MHRDTKWKCINICFTSLRQQARPGPEHHFNIFVAARPMARPVPAGSDSFPCSSVYHTVCFCFLLKVTSECLQARWPSLTSRTTRTALLLLSMLPLRLACTRWTSNMMASTSQVQHPSEEFTEIQEMFYEVQDKWYLLLFFLFSVVIHRKSFTVLCGLHEQW